MNDLKQTRERESEEVVTPGGGCGIKVEISESERAQDWGRVNRQSREGQISQSSKPSQADTSEVQLQVVDRGGDQEPSKTQRAAVFCTM
jgi:hypothetical protein